MSNKIIFLHGFTQCGAIWEPILEHVRNALPDFEIITPDLPGHGDTPISADDNLWSTANDLANTYGPAHWVGYSLGGRTLLHIAITHSEMIKSMTVVGAQSGFEDRSKAAERQAADERLASRIEKMSRDELRKWLTEEWLTMPMFAGLLPKDGKPDMRQIDLRVANNPSSLAASLRQHGPGTQDFLLPQLKESNVLTTVIWAEHDSELAGKGCREITATMPNAKGHIVPNVSHAVPWEAPEKFAELITTSITNSLSTHSSPPHSRPSLQI